MTLPVALRPWADVLSTMDVELATALGPLLKDLDEFISAATTTHPHQGEPDGFGGIGRRGEPERILVSEWALAEDHPHEFLRRAATGELLYTTPEFTEPHRRGQAAVLVDAGPDQLGAARLVQLAALIVLQRREPGLLLGVLGDEPGAWQPASSTRLLRARRATRATNVEAWAETVDEMWLLSSPRLTSRRCLTTTESAWDEHGATAVRVELNGLSTELTLPGRKHGVRLLRGNLRPPARSSTLRHPLFHGNHLLARGGGDRELFALSVVHGRLRRHTLPGRVLAAATAKRRLIALVENDGDISVHVIGKKFGHLTRVRATADELGIDPAQVAAEGLAPMHLYREGSLLCLLNGRWWRLRPDHPPYETSYAVVAPGDQPEEPCTVTEPILLGPPPWHANSRDGQTWKIEGSEDITVPEGARVLALTLLDLRPAIVYQEGVILRARTAMRTRTFTTWSDAPVIVHPTQPWVAVQRTDGRIDVGHLQTIQEIATMRGDA